MENIVLIGMPGCGKSTLGQLLASSLNKVFVDADEEIVRLAGMSIPEIFKKSNLVIATGGGCVTQEANYNALHQNGHIIWIQRALNSLPTDGRPLSQTNKLEDLYAARKPMYARFADTIVQNDNDLTLVVRNILMTEGYE